MTNCIHLPPAETLEEANRQRDFWIETAAQHHRNECYYRDIVDQVGALLGKEVRTQDDGNVLPEGEILRAKVVEIATQRLAA
jgi:hypothetical protein